MNGDLVVGAEVTLITLKLFPLDCPLLLDLNNLTLLSWVSPDLMPGHVVSVEGLEGTISTGKSQYFQMISLDMMGQICLSICGIFTQFANK